MSIRTIIFAVLSTLAALTICSAIVIATTSWQHYTAARRIATMSPIADRLLQSAGEDRKSVV